MAVLHLRLDEEHLVKLLGGEMVVLEGARIILADIGWDRMEAALDTAQMRAREREGRAERR